MARRVLKGKLDRHQPARHWPFFRRTRCRECGLPHPCFVYRDAEAALRTYGDGSRPTWTEIATQPNPGVAPLLTYGQQYRADRRWAQ